MMHLVIESRLPEIRRATQLADAFRAHHALGDEDAAAICIVLDEVLSNTIRHGFDGSGTHPIALTLDLTEGEILVQVEDGGVAYDPTQAPEPVLGGTLAERTEGGLGVAFVKALTDSIEYRRVDGRNRLVMRRRVRGTWRPGP